MARHSALFTFTLLSLCDCIPWSNMELIPSSAPFTHFIYIIADNNLDPAAVNDLEEMRQNTASKNELNLVVYIDRFNDPSQEPIHNIYNCGTMTPISGTFGGSKILQKIEDTWCQIYDFGNEIDSRESGIISNFTGLMSQFELTSTYFMLELWDHGGAYGGFGSDENTPSNTNTGGIPLIQLIQAIRDGLQMTHLGRLDILGFDACIMADYSELRYIAAYQVTKYYVASEVSEPGSGWDYLNGIDAKSTNAVEYAISIIDAYANATAYSAESDAGYTLALFDMDYVQRFLNDFDSLVRMMTLAIDNYDYGMIMAVLRAESSTIYAEAQDYKIQDLGLFLANLVSDQNIFFQSCNERLKATGQHTLQYLTQSIVHFNADLVRRDTMTGSTIFWSYDSDAIYDVYRRIPDLSTTNYLRFLYSLSSVLSNLRAMASHDLLAAGQILTNASCSTSIPDDLSFHVLDETEIEYSSDYGLYKISQKVVTTTMKAETYLLYPYPSQNGTSMFFVIANLGTNIVDSDFQTTESITYWDGNVVFFVDSNNNSNSMFAAGDISFTYDATGVIPTGYIAKYPVKLYYPFLVILNMSVPGYIQFEVVLGDDAWQDSKTDMELYVCYDDGLGTLIEPVAPGTDVVIEGIAVVIVNNTVLPLPNGYLNWMSLSKNVSFYPFPVATIATIQSDVFGNVGESMVDVVTDVSYQDIETPATTATTATTMGSKGSSTTMQTILTAAASLSNLTTVTEDKIGSKEAESGLDVIATWIWLLIVISLVVVILVLISIILLPRFQKKKGKGFISKEEINDQSVHIEMGDEPLHTTETNAPVS
eukprot:157705_1